MFEQLDMFYASALQEEEKITEQDIQDMFDKRNKQKLINPRQWALYRLIRQNSLVEHRKTTQKEICDTIAGYEWNDDVKVHDHCVAIWNDIKDLNMSFEIEKVIISKNFEYWLGDEEETKAFIDKLWSDLEPRLVRYWTYLRKVSHNGQGKLLSNQLEPISDNAREFVESYGKERIS